MAPRTSIARPYGTPCRPIAALIAAVCGLCAVAPALAAPIRTAPALERAAQGPAERSPAPARGAGRLAALTFAKGSATLPADCAEVRSLADVVSWAAEHPDGLIVLAGHADPDASQAHGLRLSVRRAKAVRGLLVAAGTNPEQIVIAAFDADGARDRSVVVWGSPAQRDVVAAR